VLKQNADRYRLLKKQNSTYQAMPGPFELFVYNPGVASYLIMQGQLFDKRKAGTKQLLFEGLFSCKNRYNQVGFLNI
jgi:hypothetical protein